MVMAEDCALADIITAVAHIHKWIIKNGGSTNGVRVVIEMPEAQLAVKMVGALQHQVEGSPVNGTLSISSSPFAPYLKTEVMGTPLEFVVRVAKQQQSPPTGSEYYQRRMKP